MELAKLGLKPRDIFTRESFENAVMVHAAISGSTNSLLHIPAIAHEFGIITFGELMLRLQPYNYERFVQCDHVEFTFGGGEANVAVSLANYGMDAAFVTMLPPTPSVRLLSTPCAATAWTPP